MYVEADTYSLIQLEFDSVQNLRDFSLMGLSFAAYGHSVQLKFSPFKNDRYQLEYLTAETKFKTGIDRPIKIVEKNKFVKGRRKQNELKGEIHFKLDQKSTVTLVVLTVSASQKRRLKILRRPKFLNKPNAMRTTRIFGRATPSLSPMQP